MRFNPNRGASDRTGLTRRPRSVMGGVLVAFLVAACQGGIGPAAVTYPSPNTVGAAPAVPSAPASEPMPATSPTATPTVASVAPSQATAIDPRADGLDVGFGEFAITLEAAVIRPGPVTLVVHNAGELTHGFEMKLHGSGSGRDRKKIETRTFRSGETLRVEANLPPGIYEVECYIADHDSRGMRTTLEVRDDAPLVTPVLGTAVPGTVRIVQFAFVPVSLDVPAGTRVSWLNDDPAPHTVTADGGAFDSRQLDPGASYSIALDRPGTFEFHCEIHPTMVGTVVVH